jgi:putative ABC transport system ATP-binding protein
MPGVIAHDLSNRVGERRTAVLSGVSLEARPGELTAVVGPAGAGKTSLLHLLAGLDRPDSGSVEVDGQLLHELDELELTRVRRDRVGLLLPAASVLPTITVRENVALPLLIACRPPAPGAVDALLERVGLGDRRDYRPGELTAAERQRTALARARVGRPAVLLADEPASGLSEAEGAVLVRLLRDVAREDRIAVVLFSRTCPAVADRVLALEAGRQVPAALAAA